MIQASARRLFRRFFPGKHEWRQQGEEFADRFVASPISQQQPHPRNVDRSPLETFFDLRTEGAGIWKWRHYFEIYHRHFKTFRQRDSLVILEIGIYSGGSLDMWRDYFGPSVTIYGVDIEPACRAYEQPGTYVLVGDQADRTFWRRVLADGILPAPDIVIDDGGHTPEQQRVTLEEVLPFVRPGGVYLCEDIHGRENAFATYVSGLVDRLNGMDGTIENVDDPHRRLVVPTNGVQASIHSVHLYPYVVVIEKRETIVDELIAPKHGTQWEPFLS